MMLKSRSEIVHDLHRIDRDWAPTFIAHALFLLVTAARVEGVRFLSYTIVGPNCRSIESQGSR